MTEKRREEISGAQRENPASFVRFDHAKKSGKEAYDEIKIITPGIKGIF